MSDAMLQSRTCFACQYMFSDTSVCKCARNMDVQSFDEKGEELLRLRTRVEELEEHAAVMVEHMYELYHCYMHGGILSDEAEKFLKDHGI